MKTLTDLFLLNSEDWLFHGSSRPIDNNKLTPRKNSTISDPIGSDPNSWVFATHDPRFAILHAIKTSEDMLMISPFWSRDNKEYIFTIIANRQKFMEEFDGGHVYKLPREGFKKVSPDYHHSIEWISATEQKLQPEDTYKIPDLETVMRSGLQVFFLRDGLTKEDFNKILDDPNQSCQYRNFEDFVNSSDLIWENGKSGIYPQPALAL